MICSHVKILYEIRHRSGRTHFHILLIKGYQAKNLLTSPVAKLTELPLSSRITAMGLRLDCIAQKALAPCTSNRPR